MSLRTVNCTSCGAPLELRGGHRVESVACGFCGAVLDAHADFKVLAKFEGLRRPETPLPIGAQGRLKDVDFTVIGHVENEIRDAGESYRWLDHQLYSPTHGYAWLSLSDTGHWTFGRRVRDLPQPPTPAGLGPKAHVRVLDRTFRVFERFTAQIVFVEGELTWVARVGDSARTVEAIDPPFAFAYEEGEREWEYGLDEYLTPKAVAAAFGLKPQTMPKPNGVAPAQPFEPGWLWTGLAQAGRLFLPVSLVLLAVVFVLGWGSEVVDETVRTPARVPFTVESVAQPILLQIEAPVDQSWAFYEIEVSPQGGDPVLELGRGVEFYSGYDGDGYWSEGSTEAEARFRLDEPGAYELAIAYAEGEGGVPQSVRVRVVEGSMVLRYVAVIALLALVASLSLWWRRFRFERRRWSDGDDE